MPQGEEYICTYSHHHDTLDKFFALLVSTLVFGLKSSAPQISAELRNLSQQAVEMARILHRSSDPKKNQLTNAVNHLLLPKV